MKPVTFVGGALDALRDFPESARRAAGYQIDRLQRGLEPDDWKPMASIGAGVREIRLREVDGALRIITIATLPEAIYVLHAFQKKTQATAKRDIDLATARLRQVLRP